jgi:hypothetical protein
MSSQANRPDASQRAAAESTIAWTGNQNDDCKALWAGLILQAEQMNRKLWWWAVTIERTGEAVADSHGSEEPVRNGKAARIAAETAARNWLRVLESPNKSLERTREG